MQLGCSARVLHVRVNAARDVHRVYTYKIGAQRVETGSKQPTCSEKKVLNGFRDSHAPNLR